VSPTRRDAEGDVSADRSWESLTERLIREAQERGDFDDLPHRGQALPDRSNPFAGEMGLAFDMLLNAGIAPPWIEADKEARACLARRDALRQVARRAGSPMLATLEREMTLIVQRCNGAVARVNAEAPTPRQQRRPLDLAQELDSLRSAIDSTGRA